MVASFTSAPHGGDISVDNAYYAFQAIAVLVRFDTQGFFTDAAAWFVLRSDDARRASAGLLRRHLRRSLSLPVPFGPDGDQPPTGNLTESIKRFASTRRLIFPMRVLTQRWIPTPLPNEPSRRCGGVFDDTSISPYSVNVTSLASSLATTRRLHSRARRHGRHSMWRPSTITRRASPDPRSTGMRFTSCRIGTATSSRIASTTA